MSALNMAMNGNAYKMIEIKKVSGPVVPLSSLNPLTTLTDRYEPLPSGPNQRTFTDLNSLNHNPAYNLQHSLTSQPQSNGSITTFSPMSQSNGPTTLQRPHPPPPPSRDSTLSRGDQLQQAQHHTLQARPSASAESSTGAAQAHTSPPSKPSEETNGVSLVSQQELDFNSKEEEKWWWVCCLEFCFCLL